MLEAEKYLVEKGHHNTHWGLRIIQAEKHGEFSYEDELDSSCWTTCACGEKNPAIARDSIGAPRDKALRVAGYAFGLNILHDQFLAAAENLHNIEVRCRELLRPL